MMEVVVQSQAHLNPISRIEQFFAELYQLRLSPWFSSEDVETFLTQTVDEMFYMTFFQGTPEDYHFLFAVTSTLMGENRAFAQEVHNIHFSALENHTAAYLQVFEACDESQKLSAIESLEMEVVGYYEIPHFVEPFMDSVRHPSVSQHFHRFFHHAHAECVV